MPLLAPVSCETRRERARRFVLSRHDRNVSLQARRPIAVPGFRPRAVTSGPIDVVVLKSHSVADAKALLVQVAKGNNQLHSVVLHRDHAGAEAELRALARKMPRQLTLLGNGAVADKLSIASSLKSVTKLMLRVNSAADAITALARCPPWVTELHIDMMDDEVP